MAASALHLHTLAEWAQSQAKETQYALLKSSARSQQTASVKPVRTNKSLLPSNGLNAP